MHDDVHALAMRRVLDKRAVSPQVGAVGLKLVAFARNSITIYKSLGPPDPTLFMCPLSVILNKCAEFIDVLW